MNDNRRILKASPRTGKATPKGMMRLRSFRLSYGFSPFYKYKWRNLIRLVPRHLPPFSGKAYNVRPVHRALSLNLSAIKQKTTAYGWSFFVILPISRVLSGTVIYLRLTSPPSFGFRRATRGYMSGKRSSYGVASDRVYSKSMLPWKWVSSYLAFPALPLRAVSFCCTFPVVAYG